MVNKIKHKTAYTLLEACIVMLIVSIFIAVSANVIPHKVKPKTQTEPHGRYECYYNGNTLTERYCANDDKCQPPTNAKNGRCIFTPPKYMRFLIFNAVGGSAASGGNAGKFVSTFYSSANTKYEMVPGTYGSAGQNGNPTSVYVCADTACSVDTRQLMLKANGGAYTLGINGYKNTTIDDVNSCTIEIGPKLSEEDESSKQLARGYMCSRGPVCEIEDGKIKVSYCRTNELYRTDYIPYKKSDIASERDMSNTQFIIESPYTTWTPSTGTLIYYDTSLWDDYGTKLFDSDGQPLVYEGSNAWSPTISTLTPSLYKLTLYLNVSNGESISLMENYIKMLNLPTTEGIGSVYPGSIKSTGPNSGAVLVLW